MRRTSSKLTIWFAVAALAAERPPHCSLAEGEHQLRQEIRFKAGAHLGVESRRTGPDHDGPDRQGQSQGRAEARRADLLQEVASELTKRGLTAATGQPDLTVGYYLLLTTSINAQTVGQFLPATLDWGLPPFPQATQSLKVLNAGSLVLDFKSKDDIVWRGVAQAELRMDSDPRSASRCCGRRSANLRRFRRSEDAAPHPVKEKS